MTFIVEMLRGKSKQKKDGEKETVESITHVKTFLDLYTIDVNIIK